VAGKPARGDSPTIFEGRVPVPFVINGQTFPAGNYMVERESSSVLLIRGEKTNQANSGVEAVRRQVPADQRLGIRT